MGVSRSCLLDGWSPGVRPNKAVLTTRQPFALHIYGTEGSNHMQTHTVCLPAAMSTYSWLIQAFVPALLGDLSSPISRDPFHITALNLDRLPC